MGRGAFAGSRETGSEDIPVTLADDLIRDEGERLKPYTDSVGKITISVGVNLSDGISEDESRMLFRGRLDACIAESNARMPWLIGLPEPAQRGTRNMLYNMGWPRLGRGRSGRGRNGLRNCSGARLDEVAAGRAWYRLVRLGLCQFISGATGASWPQRPDS